MNDSRTKPSPGWKAPDTLLPRVIKAVAQLPGRTPPVPLTPADILVTAVLCATMGFMAAVAAGIVANPLAGAGAVIDAGFHVVRTIINLNIVFQKILVALLADRSVVCIFAAYLALLLPVGLGSAGGLFYLYRKALEPGRLSI